MTKSIQPALQLLCQPLWNDGNAVHTVINVVGKFLWLVSWEVGACSSPANMNKMMMVVVTTATMISCNTAVLERLKIVFFF